MDLSAQKSRAMSSFIHVSTSLARSVWGICKCAFRFKNLPPHSACRSEIPRVTEKIQYNLDKRTSITLAFFVIDPPSVASYTSESITCKWKAFSSSRDHIVVARKPQSHCCFNTHAHLSTFQCSLINQTDFQLYFHALINVRVLFNVFPHILHAFRKSQLLYYSTFCIFITKTNDGIISRPQLQYIFNSLLHAPHPRAHPRSWRESSRAIWRKAVSTRETSKSIPTAERSEESTR